MLNNMATACHLYLAFGMMSITDDPLEVGITTNDVLIVLSIINMARVRNFEVMCDKFKVDRI
jgi:hypothetical protein